jgi:hypothetical protein
MLETLNLKVAVLTFALDFPFAFGLGVFLADFVCTQTVQGKLPISFCHMLWNEGLLGFYPLSAKSRDANTGRDGRRAYTQPQEDF